jgi:RNase H-like domain found in reverse transcriptase
MLLDWTKSHERQFERLVNVLRRRHVLVFANEDDCLVKATFASCSAVGGRIYKILENNALKEECRLPIAFFSNKVSDSEKRYLVIEKQLLAIVRGEETYKHFLLSIKHNIVVETDHVNLVSLRKFCISQKRHLKWFIVLSRIPFKLRHK